MWRGSEGISEQFQTRGETRRRDAALNTHTGEIVGNAVPRHTSDEFVAFLQSVVDPQAPRRAIHIIVDNLSAHETQKVRTLHYTPSYSSWLNQVELWFSKIERDAS